MHTGHCRDRFAGIHGYDERSRKNHTEIQLAATDLLHVGAARFRFHIADIGKALRAQQLLCNVLRRDTDATDLTQADRSRFRRPLVGVSYAAGAESQWRQPLTGWPGNDDDFG